MPKHCVLLYFRGRSPKLCIFNCFRACSQESDKPELVGCAIETCATISWSKKVFILEEHQMNGGLRDIISNVIVSNKINLSKFFAFGINDQFCSFNGTYDGIKKKYNLTENQISKKILENLKK